MLWHRLSAFIVFLSLAVSPAAAAERLDAEKTKALLFQGPWRIETGVSFDYFLWKPNRTLCVKLFHPGDSACHDTGSWFRNQTIVCYQPPPSDFNRTNGSVRVQPLRDTQSDRRM